MNASFRGAACGDVGIRLSFWGNYGLPRLLAQARNDVFFMVF